MSVARIVEMHDLDTPFQRGAEIRIRFGGSAIVAFGEAGAWRPADDMIENTRKGIERLVHLGEEIARRIVRREVPLQRDAQPRSVNVMSGDARRLWEHSIPPVDTRRYSITFRTMV